MFYSPHDIQLRAVFIAGARQWSFLQVPTAAATTFICADSRTPVQNKHTDYIYKYIWTKKKVLFVFAKSCFPHPKSFWANTHCKNNNNRKKTHSLSHIRFVLYQASVHFHRVNKGKIKCSNPSQIISGLPSSLTTWSPALALIKLFGNCRNKNKEKRRKRERETSVWSVRSFYGDLNHLAWSQ